MRHVIRIRNLTKKYKVSRHESITALKDISIHMHEFEVVALVGESGSGKTTLIQVLFGLTPHDSGDYETTEERALVLQDPYASLCPTFTIQEILIEAFLMKKTLGTKVEWLSQIEATLESMDLNFQEIKDKLPSQMSGGQLQRIAICRALLLKPQLIVMDEPTSMLDELNTHKISEIIKKLSAHAAVLIVTHDIVFAQAVSDRMIVLRKGQVVDEFESGAIDSSDRNSYTQELTLATTDLKTYLYKGE